MAFGFWWPAGWLVLDGLLLVVLMDFRGILMAVVGFHYWLLASGVNNLEI